MNYVKSKQRVADHGEVFTPPWMVEAMLDLVKDKTERIDPRFLEPGCGSGNFLVQIVYLGKGKFQWRDFRLDILTLSSTFSTEGPLFAQLGKHEIFTPAETYAPMAVRELVAAHGAREDV